MTFDPRHKSRIILDGPDRAAARAFFKAIGFTDDDLKRPLIGVVKPMALKNEIGRAHV